MRILTHRRSLVVAAIVGLCAFSATAIAGHDRRPQTDQVSARIVFGPAQVNEQPCAGLDGTHIQGTVTGQGTSTGDPRLSGNVAIRVQGLFSEQGGIETGRLVIRDPATGRKKADASFTSVLRDEISQGLLVGRVFDEGSGGEETTGAGRFVANWRVTFGPTVMAQIGGMAADGRLPAVIQSGRCPGASDDDDDDDDDKRSSRRKTKSRWDD